MKGVHHSMPANMGVSINSGVFEALRGDRSILGPYQAKFLESPIQWPLYANPFIPFSTASINSKGSKFARPISSNHWGTLQNVQESRHHQPGKFDTRIPTISIAGAMGGSATYQE